MFDYSEVGNNKYVYMPKIGASLEIGIKEIKKVTEGKDQFHFKVKEKVTLPDGTEASIDKSLGYHIEVELDNEKVLSITSLAAFLSVFKKYELNDGDRAKITHKAKGEWEVIKL